VVVDDLDVVGVAVMPTEAYPPLPIAGDASCSAPEALSAGTVALCDVKTLQKPLIEGYGGIAIGRAERWNPSHLRLSTFRVRLLDVKGLGVRSVAMRSLRRRLS
jgi:hypothetical protein